MSKQYTKKQYQEIFNKNMQIWVNDPIEFIRAMWNLTPQPLKPEHEMAVRILISQNDFNHFDPNWFEPFVRGKHITWQQWAILLAVTAAITNKASKRITIASAHGIGKSCSMSWTLLWFLFCHQFAQIAVTAPTSKQLFDVLWKELSLWINHLDPFWQKYYEWQRTYIRHTSAKDGWFASAKTSKKDSTEALAGVHGAHVMVIADEASGVPSEVFDTMEGSLTEEDILVILISNPTRLSGYFYETHNKPKIAEKWQRLQFDNLSAPIVRDDYNQDIIDRHGKNSDEYRIRVLGQFPEADSVDDKGYTTLLTKKDINEIERPHILDKNFWIGTPIMGIDPAGEGQDETRWVIRDQFKAATVLKEKVSDKLSIARKTRTLMEIHNVQPHNIYIDSFGVGVESAVEIAKGGLDINPINVGDVPTDTDDKALYLNKRARNYTRTKKAIKSGFQLVRNKAWEDELPNIRQRRNEKGKIQIMPKRESKKAGYHSPNTADALMLTFEEDTPLGGVRTFKKNERTHNQHNANNQNQTTLSHTQNNLHSAI